MFSQTARGIRLTGDYSSEEIPKGYREELKSIIHDWYMFLDRTVGVKAGILYVYQNSELNFYPYDAPARTKIESTYTIGFDDHLESISNRLNFILDELANIKRVVAILRFFFKHAWDAYLFPEHPLSRCKNTDYWDEYARVLTPSNASFIKQTEETYYSFVAASMLREI